MGISTDVVNLRTLVPIDEYAILDGAERSQLVVTLEDHFKIGGLYSMIAELFQRDGMVAEVLPFALDGKWFKPALLNDVLHYEGFTAEQIVEKIRARLAEVAINDDSTFGDYLSLN